MMFRGRIHVLIFYWRRDHSRPSHWMWGDGRHFVLAGLVGRRRWRFDLKVPGLDLSSRPPVWILIGFPRGFGLL